MCRNVDACITIALARASYIATYLGYRVSTSDILYTEVPAVHTALHQSTTSNHRYSTIVSVLASRKPGAPSSGSIIRLHRHYNPSSLVISGSQCIRILYSPNNHWHTFKWIPEKWSPDKWSARKMVHEKWSPDKWSPRKRVYEKNGPRKIGPRKNGPREKWSPEKWSARKMVPEKMVPEKWSPGNWSLGKWSPGNWSPEKWSLGISETKNLGVGVKHRDVCVCVEYSRKQMKLFEWKNKKFDELIINIKRTNFVLTKLNRTTIGKSE